MSLLSPQANIALAAVSRLDSPVPVSQEGAVEASRRTCKSLEAAIATAKMPGYFTHYKPPEAVVAAEKDGTMRKLSKQLAAAEEESQKASQALDAAKKEATDRAAADARRAQEGHGAGRSLKDWLRVNGRPRAPAEGMLSTLEPSGRVYGGGKHVGPFRSVAVSMKHGRVTR